MKSYEEVVYEFAKRKESQYGKGVVIEGSAKIRTDTDWGFSTLTPGIGAFHELVYKVEGVSKKGNPHPRDCCIDLGNDLPGLLKELLAIAQEQ